jgi:phage terminase large subunit GpA-like protein
VNLCAPTARGGVSMQTLTDEEWWAEQCDALTTELTEMTPSEWAEEKRYLPKQVTPLPGPFRFDVCPFMREIVDCLSVDSPIRDVALMKGAQTTGTVAVLENGVGYYIEHVKTAPIMLMTADAELAKYRLETNVIPMLQLSGLAHLIRSSDESNNRKTGKTDKKVEWEGGGYLVPFGAKNADKMRSFSIQILLRDEVDGWPITVGKDGDPMKLSETRTNGYADSRKILDISTPTIKGQSNIEKRFLLGDQRHYYVRCLNPKCSHPQVLKFQHTNNDTGEPCGIVWGYDELGRLDEDSVRYLCEKCGHAHRNEDKIRLLSPDHGAEWKPHAPGSSATFRSYHVSALYSPVGMFSWVDVVKNWLAVWDVQNNRPRDMEQFQVFYNNVLGEPFVVTGEKLRFEQVSPHRRHEYRYGEVPNKFAIKHCGGPIQVITCAVDVHKHHLNVAPMGWCRDRRPFLIDYWNWKGDCENLNDPDTWGKLDELLQNKTYEADDGQRYRLQLTLIDSGYRSDLVYDFCNTFVNGVYPSKGQPFAPRSARTKEFSEFTTPLGQQAFGITVDHYKDRWGAGLKRTWDGVSLQSDVQFNAPIDITDKQLKELTNEYKREKIDARTGQRLGFEWYRPPGSPNELWDLLVLNNAAYELLAWDVCVRQLEMEGVNWPEFHAICERDRPFNVKQ